MTRAAGGGWTALPRAEARAEGPADARIAAYAERVKDAFPEVFGEGADVEVSFEEFEQGWANSAGGMLREGMAVCDMLTKGTTTVVEASVGAPARRVAYGVFFDGEFAYALLRPEGAVGGAFLDDLAARRVEPIVGAERSYADGEWELRVPPAPPRRKIRIRRDDGR